jgi:tRNA-2-methylthio-N6-dimethylallyladenosine synthase
MKRKLTYFVRTYGCQANIRDGESISGILENMKFKKSNEIRSADIVILNTCAVREKAEKKVFGEIGFLQNNRLHNKNFILGVCGCMAHEQQTIKKYSSNKQVDFIFGTKNINQLPEIINDVIENKKQRINVCESSMLVDDLPTKRSSKIKAFVNVMYGCNKFCSYCIVPFTRGRVISRPKQDIINEVKSLASKGYKEVTLLGQNVNSYGIDFKDHDYSFANLLEDVAKINIPRIRFCTSNP